MKNYVEFKRKSSEDSVGLICTKGIQAIICDKRYDEKVDGYKIIINYKSRETLNEFYFDTKEEMMKVYDKIRRLLK